MSPILILNDGRPGHLNQSIAFARYMGLSYDVAEVLPRFRWSKAATLLFDMLGVRTQKLFWPVSFEDKRYDYVVGTGSWTYYMTKVIAKYLGARSVAMMLPKGYRYDFDLIFAQYHDKPPRGSNIIEIPANFAYVEPQGLYRAKNKALGLVIGGDNSLFTMEREMLKSQLDFILDHFKSYEVAVTTSPRTPKEIEALIETYGFDYQVIYSKNPVNPIADFLEQCETVCITGDSTSMISEAVSYGNANIVVLPLRAKSPNKFTKFVESLEKEGYVHLFNGTIKLVHKKIDFSHYIQKVLP